LKTPGSSGSPTGVADQADQADQYAAYAVKDLANVEFRSIPSSLQAYATAAPHERTVRVGSDAVVDVPPRSRPADSPPLTSILSSGQPDGSGHYGGDLFSEVNRYARIAVKLAEGEGLDVVLDEAGGAVHQRMVAAPWPGCRRSRTRGPLPLCPGPARHPRPLPPCHVCPAPPDRRTPPPDRTTPPPDRTTDRLGDGCARPDDGPSGSAVGSCTIVANLIVGGHVAATRAAAARVLTHAAPGPDGGIRLGRSPGPR
jgi:hypothetical protein